MLNDLASSSWMEPKKWGNIFAENKRPRSLLSSWENMLYLGLLQIGKFP